VLKKARKKIKIYYNRKQSDCQPLACRSTWRTFPYIARKPSKKDIDVAPKGLIAGFQSTHHTVKSSRGHLITQSSRRK